MRGGESFITSAVYITGRAWAQYESYNYGDRKRELAIALTGVTVRCMADDSPYFIYSSGPMRYVFCIQRGHTANGGKFCLVTVQLSYGEKS